MVREAKATTDKAAPKRKRAPRQPKPTASPGNGQDAATTVEVVEPNTVELETPAASTNGMQYREFTPQVLPEGFRYMLPGWLFQSLMWGDRVKPLKVEPDDSTMHKLQVGSAIVALVIFGIVFLLVMLVLIDA